MVLTENGSGDAKMRTTRKEEEKEEDLFVDEEGGKNDQDGYDEAGYDQDGYDEDYEEDDGGWLPGSPTAARGQHGASSTCMDSPCSKIAVKPRRIGRERRERGSPDVSRSRAAA